MGIAVAGAMFPLIERVAPCTIEGDGGRGFEGIFIAGAGADAGDAIAVFQEIEGCGVFTNFDALGAGVVEEHEVEVLALDLPSGGGGVVEVLEEIEGRGDFSVGGGKLDAVFTSETDFRHAVDDTEAVQREPAKRHKRLADVVAGESGFLNEEDAMAFLRKESRGGGAGGAAADDDSIVVHWRLSIEYFSKEGFRGCGLRFLIRLSLGDCSVQIRFFQREIVKKCFRVSG